MKTTAATMLLALVVASPAPAAAQDEWLGADKVKHFGAGAGIAAGGYAVAIPLARTKRWRVVIGATAGLGVAAGKEIRDRSHGTPSWRDFSWAAAGTATGVLLAWTIDKLTD